MAVERTAGTTSIGPRKLQRRVGLVALMFTSVGSIIGSGWLLGALTASKVAGPAALISWVLGAVAILFLALVHAELGGMFPVAGGSGRYPHFAFGSLAGFGSAWIWYLGAVTVAPAEVEAALSYADNYLPGLIDSHTGTLTVPVGFIVAAALMGVFATINVLGVRWLAQTNLYTVIWKIAIPVLTVIIFLALFHHFDNLTSHGFVPNGVPSIFAALSSGIIFAYLGFEQAVEFGAESRNPQRNVPLAVIGSVVIGVVIYLALALAFATSFEPSALSKGWSNLSFPGSFGPYAAIASAAGLSFLALLLYIDAAISPAGTGLLYVGSSARMSFGMARNRYIPDLFDQLNGRHVPVVSIVVAMVLGFLFLLPFPSWQELITIITGATVLSYGLQPLALTALRRQVPDAPRPYRLPFGEVLSPVAFIVANLIIYWSGWNADWKLMAAVLAGFVILAATFLLAPAERRPTLEWRAAYWLVPYLGGLTLISYLGATDFGGRGLLPFGWDALVVAVFSVAIYALAVGLRLPEADARRSIEEQSAEAEAEEELLVAG
ncbi:MAG TPA: APC family permease [Candidatus Dormibacteraeota bacterium]|nr:APC family permease [Candidatus Dormibacteraeota bacterium]